MSRVETDGRGRGVRRPAEERRRELATAAADAFRRHGFHQVTMAGIAATVGVSAPAVYRHFRNKNDLLAGALDSGLADIRAALEPADADHPLPAMIEKLARTALRRPDFWVLLQREVRHLDVDSQHRARADFRDAILPVDAALAQSRPELDARSRELLVVATMAVLATPSVHPPSMARSRLLLLLCAAAEAVCRVAVGAGPDGPPDHHPTPPPHSSASSARAPRAEEILDAAVSLFHRDGYTAVSLDDIGRAVGMAGPSIYHHYPTKADLLAAASDRVIAHLPPADDDLDATVRAYVAMAVHHRESLGLSVTERLHLPSAAAARLHRASRRDSGTWVAALRTRRPELLGDEAALLVDAAHTVVHDAVRIGRLHRRPGVADDLVLLVAAVLATVGPRRS